MAIDAPTGRGPTHAVGAGDLEPSLPGLGAYPAGPPYASWGRRVVAYLLDTAIVGTVSFLAVGPAASPQILPGVTVVTSDGATVGQSGWLVATTVAFVLLQAYAGWTPGKRTVGIVVVREETGRAAGLITTVLRWLAHVLDAIFLIGFLRPLWDPRRRTFADSLCSTVVLRRVRPLVPFRSPGSASGTASGTVSATAPGGTAFGRPTASRTVTAAATVLSVGSVVFVLGPSAEGPASATACGMLDAPGSPVAEEVRVTPGDTEAWVSRWGVTRTAPPADTSGDLVASFSPFATGLVTDGGVEEQRVLRVVGDDGTVLAERRVTLEVEPLDDGSVSIVFDADSADAGSHDPATELRVDAATLDGLPPGWHWVVEVSADGQVPATCVGAPPA